MAKKLNFKFHPKLFDTIRNYSLKSFISDLMAGIIVGIVALPLAMAFGIASGVTPEQGIFTAIVAGFIISAFGGSKVQIGGPTGAFVIIVAGVVGTYGIQALYICTIFAGILLVIMSILKMGIVIKYIPRPVVIGFTNGIAVIIFSTQIKDFFGIEIENLPSDFLEKMQMLAKNFSALDWKTTLVSSVSLLSMILWPVKLRRKFPSAVVGLIVGTLASVLMSLVGWDVATIYSKFGEIPNSLPTITIPDFKWADMKGLIIPSITIALLAAIESLLSAVVADGMIDDKHDSNQELFAQGVANIFAPLFCGIPATGAIARTATNVRNGAKTPIAGIIHVLTLLLILMVFSPYAKYIPLGCLAAILFVVSFNMGDWREFRFIKRMTKSDATVFIITFLLTVLFDLTIAVEVGMLLAAILFIRRITHSTHVEVVDHENEIADLRNSIEGKEIPRGVMVFRIFGALMFGAADKLDNVLRGVATPPKIVILRMRTVMALDSTAIDSLKQLYIKLKSTGAILILSGTHSQPLEMLKKSGLYDTIGKENICDNIDVSLEVAKKILDEQKTV